MKINLSEAELGKLQNIFTSLDENIASGEEYNEILSKKIKKNAYTGSLPWDYLSAGAILSDPYYLHVKPTPVARKKWEIVYEKYDPDEGFVYDELRIDPKKGYKETTPFGSFRKRFPFLAVKENGLTWMSVTPHEVNTMADGVKKAKGKVVTYGLGLGYFAYMCLLKDDVESLTVVEKDPTIISLFKTSILPFFEHKEKLTVVHEDAFKFAETSDGFDYQYVDLWHLPFDGLPLYIRMRKIEEDKKLENVDYWIEPSLLSLLRRALVIMFQEELKGATDEDYDFAATPSDILVNSLHFALKKKTINTAQDFLDLISDLSLKAIAPRLDY